MTRPKAYHYNVDGVQVTLERNSSRDKAADMVTMAENWAAYAQQRYGEELSKRGAQIAGITVKWDENGRLTLEIECREVE